MPSDMLWFVVFIDGFNCQDIPGNNLKVIIMKNLVEDRELIIE